MTSVNIFNLISSYSGIPEIIHVGIQEHFIPARKTEHCKPAFLAFIRAKPFSALTCKMRTDCINFSIYIENYNFICDISQHLEEFLPREKRISNMKMSSSKKSKMDENTNEEKKQLIVN